MAKLISISKVRANLPDLVDQVGSNSEEVTITVHGQPKATLINSRQLEATDQPVTITDTTSFASFLNKLKPGKRLSIEERKTLYNRSLNQKYGQDLS